MLKYNKFGELAVENEAGTQVIPPAQNFVSTDVLSEKQIAAQQAKQAVIDKNVFMAKLAAQKAAQAKIDAEKKALKKYNNMVFKTNRMMAQQNIMKDKREADVMRAAIDYIQTPHDKITVSDTGFSPALGSGHFSPGTDWDMVTARTRMGNSTGRYVTLPDSSVRVTNEQNALSRASGIKEQVNERPANFDQGYITPGKQEAFGSAMGFDIGQWFSDTVDQTLENAQDHAQADLDKLAAQILDTNLGIPQASGNSGGSVPKVVTVTKPPTFMTAQTIKGISNQTLLIGVSALVSVVIAVVAMKGRKA